MEKNNVEPVGKMEEEALKRKQKLNLLRRKLDAKDSESDDERKRKRLQKRPKFRCYRPADESLQSDALPDAQRENVEDQVQEQLASAHSQPPIDELDISNLAPRKPDWDLKRDCAKKLEKLDILTKQAISGLIRDRLKETIEGSDSTSSQQAVTEGSETSESV